jgi:transcriptional activator SPT7
MLRNVKSGRYKSKAQFMRDLDLIWDNCLTYNSEPTHPLRRSVQLLRGKANHLLTYVNDTNDVKEALSQWQASSTSTTNTRSGSALHVGSPWADSAVHPNGSNKGSLLSNGRSMSVSRR